MATSNRDRIGQMFDVISPVLNRFIADIVEPALPAGASWTAVVAAKDSKSGMGGKEYNPLDPQIQLRMIADNVAHQVKPGWYPFKDALSRVQQTYATELKDARNAWAHMKSFTDDDAYRALDTGERFLMAIGAADTANTVAKLRLDLRRVTADKDDKRTLKDVTNNPESAGLKPWREVLPPHADVATGNFQAAEFAADLYKVASGAADQSKDYADPVEFFSRTYLTDGLRDLISRAVRRLSGDDNASPVINLQTNFGGGKTHSMLSLWHLAAGLPRTGYGQELQELLGAHHYDDLPDVRRVAIVGNHLAPSGETKPDGTTVHTIWGELAWQLGGAEGYAMVADADGNGTLPGRALHDLLARYSPAVVLIDEWVAYARQLYGRSDLAGGTFETQFGFAQALTEASKGTPGVLLAISIPASHDGDSDTPAAGSAEEVGGANGLEALKQLQNVVRRVADQWRPASSSEAYHIVRQRLFVTPGSAALAEIGRTARAFVEMYRGSEADFPREARDSAYEDRIKLTYPIHPELFDRLYEDWSSLERFQRTRGVLRLMNTVIHALWVGEDQGPLIMPGSLPLASAQVNAELTQYLQDSWKPVIDADVDGPHSEPVRIDRDKPQFGQRSLTKRLARTVFFGSAPTLGSSQKGIEAQRVFLGTATPGDRSGNFFSALNALSDKATYFYAGSGKYWYDLQANISRRAKDQAERKHPEDVWAEIVRRLGDQARTRGDFAGVHVSPEGSDDIPDTDEARLVILHPRDTHKRNDGGSAATTFVQRAIESRGTANRRHRNMLVFLAADTDRMAELDTAVRDYLGWSDVLAEADSLELTTSQANQARSKKQQAETTLTARLLGAYHWALVPTAPDPSKPFVIAVSKAEGQAPSLAERVTRRLANDGELQTRQAARSVRLQLDRVQALWQQGWVSVATLWDTYLDYCYMPRLRDVRVLLDGLTEQPLHWQQEGFALADSYDAETERFVGLWLPGDPSVPAMTTGGLLVRPDRAMAQRERDRTEPQPPIDPPIVDPPPPPPPGRQQPTRYFGVVELDPRSYALAFKKIHDEILSHLAATPGVRMTLRLDIEADTPGGFDESRVRTISENGTVLGFDQSGFETR